MGALQQAVGVQAVGVLAARDAEQAFSEVYGLRQVLTLKLLVWALWAQEAAAQQKVHQVHLLANTSATHQASD